MLFLTRRAKEGENAIVVTTVSGERIRILLREIDGRQVRIGIEAPSNVSIMREELVS